MAHQLEGVLVAWVKAILGTLVILGVVDLVIGLRAADRDEDRGLDLSRHGEEGYNYET
jgi:Amt family ammonium transporter